MTLSGHHDNLTPRGSPRVVITGMAVLTTLADALEPFHQALSAGRSGVTRWKNPLYANCDSQIGGDLWGYDREGKLASLRMRLPAETFRRLRRLAGNSPAAANTVMLVAAEAFAHAGLFGAAAPHRTSAILAGHYLYDLYKLANWRAYEAEPDGIEVSFGLKEIDSDALACTAEVLGICGPAYGVGGACAAGNLGLRAALDEIRHHGAEVALVVSGSHELTPAALHSLAKLGALSLEGWQDEPARASRPFDAARNGFVPAAGAAALILESLAHARRRGAPILAEVLGVGVTTNGSRSPTPAEEPMARAMEQALAEAGIDKTAINYVSAHATSTPLGDLAEARAIGRVFGEQAAKLKVNALKSMLGHQLAASVLVETVAAVLQLRAGQLYPSINIDRLDPEIDLDVCANHGVAWRVDFLMKNAFGFGGVNTACVMGRCDG
ncbi:MAG: beta-ketoacyl-[acyl-carrier-protein] synthase family protein [Deltaproteobacteria bacterium]|nr:beta-ketoacyl-[acyl-carrier-protein] synthase family protein [Deltaproteobacteria bacterium]